MSDQGRILIVGAGPCGLGAALWLTEHGYDDFLVLEGEKYPGGLSASFVDKSGFVWDLGGHVTFSHYKEFDSLIDRAVSEWVWHVRESWIWTQMRWVPYPFQYNIHRLDKADRDAVLADLKERLGRQSAKAPDSFADWIQEGFGPALERLFLRPYNLKVWGYPLEKMGAKWLGERVAGPDYERVKRVVDSNQDDPGWGPNARFRFPSTGGTGAIWHGAASMVKKDKIIYNSTVTSIDLDHRKVQLSDGSEQKWDKIISTAPLDWLCRNISGLPGKLSKQVDDLGYSSTHVIGLGLRGGKPADLMEKCWMYFPDSTSPYYRVTHFSHYGPGNAPGGCWSLMAEVCETEYKPVDSAKVVPETIEALRSDRLIGNGTEILSQWYRRLEYGYPIPLRNRDDILQEVMPVLESRDIFSRGRFGGWKYEVGNMDHSFKQGMEVAARCVTGAAEEVWML